VTPGLEGPSSKTSKKLAGIRGMWNGQIGYHTAVIRAQASWARQCEFGQNLHRIA